ncbi:MAG: GNAT family N-acetyltransferase [Rhodospirillales bacterium]|nr:GNAT family N-acetyltransferase [Rhodospirillales bacterium]
MTEAKIRPARREDSRTIAELFLISSDGLAAYIWSKVAEPGETTLDAGARRYARDGVAFSYQNCVLADLDGTVAGMAHSFPMDADPAAQAEADPVLRPYAELEDCGSLYLSGIALFPEHRGRGIGTQLMTAVDDRARALNRPRLSLICFERNEGAMRWYRRLGFEELARRPLVPDPLLHYPDGDAVLLARGVDAAASGRGSR